MTPFQFVKELNDWETPCPNREDGIHCNCWYDGGRCCACGDDTKETDEHKEFERDSGIVRDPVNGWAIRND